MGLRLVWGATRTAVYRLLELWGVPQVTAMIGQAPSAKPYGTFTKLAAR